MALTDAPGNLVNFGLRPGQPRDTGGVAGLIDGVNLGGLIADKAFDVNSIAEDLDQRGAGIVISQHPDRVAPREIDTEACKWCHLIENFFCSLKRLQTHRTAGLQDRQQFLGNDLRQCSRDKLKMNLNRPWPNARRQTDIAAPADIKQVAATSP